MTIAVAKGREAILINDEAILAGGSHGGDYLDSIGITDLAALNKEQWVMFCARVVRGTLVRALGLSSNEIPF